MRAWTQGRSPQIPTAWTETCTNAPLEGHLSPDFHSEYRDLLPGERTFTMNRGRSSHVLQGGD